MSKTTVNRLWARGVTLLLLVGMLVSWAVLNISSFELTDSSGPCGLEETGHANRAEALYNLFLRPRHRNEAEKQVAVVTITPSVEPLSVLSNVCEGREFMAVLLPALVHAGVRAIAIDKFYSAGACRPEDPANAHLSQAVHDLPTGLPFIVGQATHAKASTPNAQSAECLVETQPFRFNAGEEPTSADKPGNVIYGLTRLNENTLQIPLAWPVYDTERAAQTEVKPGFAFQTAKAIWQQNSGPVSKPTSQGDTYLERLAEEASQSHHPFGVLRADMEQWSAMDLLCAPGQKNVRAAGYIWPCPSDARSQPLRLHGMIAVVGEHVSTDQQPFPGEKQYGVNLQAKYIDALLAGAYLREVNHWVDWGMAGLAVLLFAAADLLLGAFFTPRFLSKETLKDAKKELTVLACGLVIVLTLCLLNYVLMHFNQYAPICMLSVYPFVVFLLLRLVWLVFTWARDSRLSSQET